MITKTTKPTTPAINFVSTLAMVENRGRAPIGFLKELVAWGKTAPEEIFAPNRVPFDAYAVIKSRLGKANGNDGSSTPVYRWESPMHRRAAMLELMRVHAGIESSWNWKEGVDKTNKTSMANKTGEETGIFQVSFDSTWLDSAEGKNIMGDFAKKHGLEDPEAFIAKMKEDHALAMEYYARLVRVSVMWAGPLIRHSKDSVYPNLNRSAMREFMEMLKA